MPLTYIKATVQMPLDHVRLPQNIFRKLLKNIWCNSASDEKRLSYLNLLLDIMSNQILLGTKGNIDCEFFVGTPEDCSGTNTKDEILEFETKKLILDAMHANKKPLKEKELVVNEFFMNFPPILCVWEAFTCDPLEQCYPTEEEIADPKNVDLLNDLPGFQGHVPPRREMGRYSTVIWYLDENAFDMGTDNATGDFVYTKKLCEDNAAREVLLRKMWGLLLKDDVSNPLVPEQDTNKDLLRIENDEKNICNVFAKYYQSNLLDQDKELVREQCFRTLKEKHHVADGVLDQVRTSMLARNLEGEITAHSYSLQSERKLLSAQKSKSDKHLYSKFFGYGEDNARVKTCLPNIKGFTMVATPSLANSVHGQPSSYYGQVYAHNDNFVTSALQHAYGVDPITNKKKEDFVRHIGIAVRLAQHRGNQIKQLTDAHTKAKKATPWLKGKGEDGLLDLNNRSPQTGGAYAWTSYPDPLYPDARRPSWNKPDSVICRQTPHFFQASGATLVGTVKDFDHEGKLRLYFT